MSPSEMAGVAIRTSPIEFFAELFVLSAGFDHEDVAVFARAVDLAVRRDR